MTDIIYKDESYRIQGAIYQVYQRMGCGFLEEVYHECLAREFLLQKIPFASKQRLSLSYREQDLRKYYIADFVCFDKIILEIKAVEAIAPTHKAQLINYLKATGFKLGLLINFGNFPKVSIQRFAN